MATDVKAIMNAPANNSAAAAFKRNKDAFDNACDRMNDPESARYATGVEEQESGLASLRNTLEGALSRLPMYEIATDKAFNRLDSERTYLEKITTIVTDFRKADSSETNTSIGKSRADFAVEALGQIQNVLNTYVNGEYIFGGASNKTAPVTVDLTTTSNIVNGNVTTNYCAGITPNKRNISVSDIHTVQTGVDAGEGCIATLIAALSLARTADPKSDADNAKIAQYFNTGLLQINQLHYNVGKQAEDIEKIIRPYNDNFKVDTLEELNDTFKVDIVEANQDKSDAENAVYASLAIQRAMNEIDRLIFRMDI